MQLWKYVERASIVLGSIGSVVSAIFGVALYYGWNRPPIDIVGSGDATAPSPQADGIGTVAPYPPLNHFSIYVLVLFFVASAALLLLGSLMMVRRRAAGWNPAGLYVGQVHIDFGKLDSDLRIEIAIRCFNGTGVEVDITQTKGAIVCYPSVERKKGDGIKLDRAQFVDGRSPLMSLKPNSEMFPILVQHVSKDLQIRLVKWIAEGARPCLSFDEFDVMVAPSDNHSLSERLPLWSGALLNDLSGHNVGRLITARMEAGLKMKALL